MPNVYLSQSDLVTIATYDVLVRFVHRDDAAEILPPHLAWVAERTPQPAEYHGA